MKTDKRSNDEYLAEQITEARLAMESTLDDLKLDLVQATDLRRWIRRYPWAAMGAALVAGFTVAHLASSKRRQNGAAAEPVEVDEAEDQSRTSPLESKKRSIARGRDGGWKSALLDSLFDILRLAVTQLVSAGVRQAASNPAHARQKASSERRGDLPASADAAATNSGADANTRPPDAQSGAAE